MDGSVTLFVQEHQDEPRRNWCSIREPIVEWYMFDKRFKKLCGVGRISDDNMKGLTQLVAGRKAPPS